MNIFWKRALIGIICILFCAISWAWMFGYFSIPVDFASNKNPQEWSALGILSLTATLSIFAGVTGVLFLLLKHGARDNDPD